MREPRELFGDVALFHHDDRLLGDAVLIDVDACGGSDLLHALLVIGQHLLAGVFAMVGQALPQIVDDPQAREDVVAQRLPFPRTRAEHLGEGLPEDPGEPLAFLLCQLGLQRLYLE